MRRGAALLLLLGAAAAVLGSVFEMSSNQVTLPQNATSVELTINRMGSLDLPSSVHYTTVDVTASSGVLNQGSASLTGVAVASFMTDGANDVLYFSRNGRNYVVVGNSLGSTEVYLDQGAAMWLLVQNISSHTATSLDSAEFSVGGSRKFFLAIANSEGISTDSFIPTIAVNSQIFMFNDDTMQFSLFQEFSTSNCSSVSFFQINTGSDVQVGVVFANYNYQSLGGDVTTSQYQSPVYLLDSVNQQFVHTQDLPTTGPYSVISFYLGDNTFLAFAEFALQSESYLFSADGNITYNPQVMSNVYIWNGVLFSLAGSVSTINAVDVSFVTVDSGSLLIYAEMDSIMFYPISCTGTRSSAVLSIDTNSVNVQNYVINANRLEIFTVGVNTYLAVASNSTSVVLQYYGGNFAGFDDSGFSIPQSLHRLVFFSTLSSNNFLLGLSYGSSSPLYQMFEVDSSTNFGMVSGVLYFAPGEASKTATIPLFPPSQPQPTSYFLFQLSLPSPGSSIGSPSQETIMIIGSTPIPLETFDLQGNFVTQITVIEGGDNSQLVASAKTAGPDTYPSSFAFSLASGDISLFAVDTAGNVYANQLVRLSNVPASLRYALLIKFSSSDAGITTFGETWLVVNVGPSNNTQPLFTGATTASVVEKQPMGTHVITLQTQDLQDDYHYVFSINTISPPLFLGISPFTINSATGEITTTTALDHAIGPTFALYCAATNVFSTPPKVAYTTILVTVNQLNNLPPTLSMSTVDVSKPYNLAVGSTVVPWVTATIADPTIYTPVSFSIKQGNSENYFGLVTMSSMAKLTLLKPFNFYNGTRMFQIVVSFCTSAIAGIPAGKLCSDLTASISVANVNLYTPTFQSFALGSQVANVEGNFYIMDNTPVGSVLFSLVFSDQDFEDFGMISYSFNATPASNKFQFVNPDVAQLSVAELGDAGMQTLFITAADHGVPSLSSQYIAPVVILDQPVFSQTSYSFSIYDSAMPGQVVGTVSSSVVQNAGSSSLVYDIVADDSMGKFSVNPQNGDIQVTSSASLNSLVQTTMFTVTVSVTDMQAPAPLIRSQTTTVEVTVIFCSPPSFDPFPNITHISGFSRIGSFVGTVNAQSGCGGASSVAYSLLSDALGTFEINASTGVLVTAEVLQTSQEYYAIVIQAIQLNGKSSSISVWIAIDVPPTFTSDSVSIGVPEGIPGLAFYTASIRKPFSESTAYYFSIISSIPASNVFSIDSQSGILKTSSTAIISYAVAQVYTLTLRASDNLYSYSDLSLTVPIIPQSTFAPEFNMTFSASIAENLLVGSYVLTVQAIIPTYHFAGTVVAIQGYAIDPASDVYHLFTIDGATGVVTLRKNLYTVHPIFNSTTITVVATNTYQPFAFSTSTTVKINVFGVNLFRPTFPPALPTINRLAGTSPIGTVALQVRGVVDQDKRAPFNTFNFLIRGDRTRSFSISSDGRVVTRVYPLHKTTKSGIPIIIRAFDGGSPSLFSEQSVTIPVSVNYAAPSFSQHIYTVTIYDDQPLNVSIFQAIGLNSLTRAPDLSMVYSISGPSLFAIDHHSGDVYLVNPLTDMTIYEMTITVIDNADAALFATCILRVRVPPMEPRFGSSQYFLTIPESEPVGNVVYDLQILDLVDAPTFNSLTYSITMVTASASLASNQTITLAPEFVPFTINGLGQIVVTSDLRRISSDMFWLHVSAINGTGNSATTVLKITVSHASPRFPVFPSSTLYFSVPGCVPAGDQTFNIAANYGQISAVTYSIATSFPATPAVNYFSVDSTGMLKTTQPLPCAFGGQLKFSFTVGVVDNFHSELQASVTVEIMVLQIPIFAQGFYSVGAIFEQWIPATPIATVSAVAFNTPNTPDSNVSYMITGGNAAEYFDVGYYDGIITLSTPLLYADFDRFDIEILAFTHGMPSLNATTSVFGQVVEIVITPPSFSQNTVSVYVNDQTPAHVFYTASAMSNDAFDFAPNGPFPVHYMLQNAGNLFAIDDLSGAVSVLAPLDYDVDITRQYSLEIVAFKNAPFANGFQAANLSLTVLVIDFNDSIPVFDSSSLNLQVNELVPPGTLVGTVLATLAEEPGRHYLIYSLANNSYFMINPLSGDLTTTSVIDYHFVQQVQIPVFVRMFHVIPSVNDVNATAVSAMINVEIINLNQHAPVFEGVDSNGYYQVTILQTAALNSVVFTVSASDSDAAQYGMIANYMIVDGNTANTFAINKQGQVSLITPPPINFHGFNLSITAFDGGSPTGTALLDKQLAATTILSISVTPVNLGGPQFSPTTYWSTFNERPSAGIVVATVFAVDTNVLMPPVRYSIDSTSPIAAAFTIDSVTGTITTSSSAARILNTNIQKQENFSFSVIAAVTPSIFSSATVYITLELLNEFEPFFVNPPTSVSITEGPPMNEPIATMIASDADYKGGVHYSIGAGNSGSIFSIDSVSGALMQTVALVYSEGDSIINLVIIATDFGNPPLSVSTNLQVTILPANLFSPVVSSSVTATLNENSPIGTTVSVISAYDPDMARGVIIGGSVAGFQLTTFQSLFQIDNLGVLKTLRPLKAIPTSYHLVIQVSDNGLPPLSTTFHFTVRILPILGTPKFADHIMGKAVVESSSVGTLVAALNVFGPAPDSLYLFNITSGNEDSMFGIESHSGQVTVSGKLNRAAKAFYSLRVVVVLEIDPSFMDTATLNVIVDPAFFANPNLLVCEATCLPTTPTTTTTTTMPTPCPANSFGASVSSGCACNAGFSGAVTATMEFPFYSSTCSPVKCPDNSDGLGVSAGCVCNAGFSGSVSASTTAPFYFSSCAAVQCPSDSFGSSVSKGCACNAGFSGSVMATMTYPFYFSTCAYVACPTNSHGSSVSDGCMCNAGFEGLVTATTVEPFYNNDCIAVACPTDSNTNGRSVPEGCACNAGFSGSVTATTASPFYSSSCATVQCPVSSNGLSVSDGCACDAGFSGGVTATTFDPYFFSTCTIVRCPSNSFGTSVSDGCTCNPGFSGSVSATTSAPFYWSSCAKVGCPVNSYGDSVSDGCMCNAGFSGSVVASLTAPFYNSTCKAVLCPDFSNGADVSNGCACNAGFSGSVMPTMADPFYSSTCSPVECPANSKGDLVSSSGCLCEMEMESSGCLCSLVSLGCLCDAGFSGSVSATTISPFFSSSCSKVACPASSNGSNVPDGCMCNSGFSGAVVASMTAPFYNSTCGAVDCPMYSNGVDVPNGCACNAGFSGSVMATSMDPFFSSTCAPVACPEYSNGKSVSDGCMCDYNYVGSVTPTTTFPFYSSTCAYAFASVDMLFNVDFPNDTACAFPFEFNGASYSTCTLNSTPSIPSNSGAVPHPSTTLTNPATVHAIFKL